MNIQIGIDLGTTNSVVAFLENNKPVVLPNAEGNKTTPSVVLFRSGDEIIVGELAKRQMVSNPSNAVSSIKRFMGRRFNEIEEIKRSVDYVIKEDSKSGRILLDMGWSKVSPEEVSSRILKKLKDDAEEYLGEDVKQAVITVPAYFNDSQRSATKTAGEIAGLELLRIINEPTAAALAYGIDKIGSETIAVFDFGGGTFDISILEMDNNIFEVLSTNGDTCLGGDNIDQCIFDFIRDEIIKECGADIVSDPQAVQRVREVAEKIKCELSSILSTTISLPFIVSDEKGPKHFNREFTIEDLNRLSLPVLERLIPPCRNALMDAGLTPNDIDTVILVGGSSRIVKVKEMVSEFFNKEPLTIANPEEVVARGAAIQAGILCGSLQEILLLDVTPLSLGIELAEDLFSVIIPRNSNIPTTASKKFTTVVDNQRNVYVHVLQGERKIASENRSLAHFRLTDISPAPREVPEVEVGFHIDANGILNVSAKDLTSGISKEVKVESYQTSIPEDYEKDIKEAEERAEEDAAYVRMVRRKERVNHIIDFFRKFVVDEEEKLEPKDKESMLNFITQVEDCLKNKDIEEAEKWVAALQALLEKYSGIFMKFRYEDDDKTPKP